MLTEPHTHARMKTRDANWFELKGKIITSISRTGEEIETSDGKKYRLVHHQSCCENVEHHCTIGSPSEITGRVITLAEEDIKNEDPEWVENKHGLGNSFTWSMYALQANKTRVEFWFLGESNGYYGEEMSFEEILP